MKTDRTLTVFRRIVPFILVGVIIAFGACAPARVVPTAEESAALEEKLANDNGSLQEMNRLCTDLPKPEGFKFAFKRRMHRRAGLAFRYESASDFETVKRYFDEQLRSDGWNLVDANGLVRSAVEYKKTGIKISLEEALDSGFEVGSGFYVYCWRE